MQRPQLYAQNSIIDVVNAHPQLLKLIKDLSTHIENLDRYIDYLESDNQDDYKECDNCGCELAHETYVVNQGLCFSCIDAIN